MSVRMRNRMLSMSMLDVRDTRPVPASPILVTGGTGTLGRLVVARLRAAGCDVRVLSRRSRDSEEGIESVTGNLATDEGTEAAVAGAEVIVHCAGST